MSRHIGAPNRLLNFISGSWSREMRWYETGSNDYHSIAQNSTNQTRGSKKVHSPLSYWALYFYNELCDPRANAIYKKLGLGVLELIIYLLQLANGGVERARGVGENIVIKIDKFLILKTLWWLIEMSRSFRYTCDPGNALSSYKWSPKQHARQNIYIKGRRWAKNLQCAQVVQENQ